MNKEIKIIIEGDASPGAVFQAIKNCCRDHFQKYTIERKEGDKLFKHPAKNDKSN